MQSVCREGQEQVFCFGQRCRQPVFVTVSLLIAALSAEGTSTIDNIEQIRRGYQDIEGRLDAIGARIDVI